MTLSPPSACSWAACIPTARRATTVASPAANSSYP